MQKFVALREIIPDKMRKNRRNGHLVPDISQKMLTSTLKSLEADGYVTRKAYAEVPPRVEYSLTPRAETLIPIMDHLIEWALDNMAVILKDRDKAAG